MTSSKDSLLDRLSQPEYTGENRCIPCTLVNVFLAAVLGSAVSRLSKRSLGALAFVGSLLLIYLRGYLVPGTPALTKRYFPDWLLALFDKEPEPFQNTAVGGGLSRSTGAGNGQSHENREETENTESQQTGEPLPSEGPVDPEVILSSADVVEPCADEDDLCLTDSFASAWRAECDELRDEDVRLDRLMTLFETDSVSVSTDPRRGQVSVMDAGDELAVWPSEGAMVADLAADQVLTSRVREWNAVDPEQRFGILAGLRSFLDSCPICDGPIELGQNTMKSCCRSWEVVSVRCTECDSHLLELDPDTLETVA